MSAPGLTIRAPATPAEFDAFFRLATETFIGSADVERVAAGWLEHVATAPQDAPYHLRAAYRGGQHLGGCVMQERVLRLGAARLRTGCIAAVVTRPEHRSQGVAAALMRDAATFAQGLGCSLLLLGGIPDFYDRFGYADVLEITEHAVESAALLREPGSPCTIRPGFVRDAAALLALYERHYGPRRGSFERSLPQQEHYLRLRQAMGDPPLLALDPDGSPCGYLIHPWTPDDTYTAELAADHWPALLALLQHQARRPAPVEAAKELGFPLPSDSSTFYLLADRLPVRSRTHHHPRAGWMARPAHLPTLFQAMLPEWQACCQRRRVGWSGAFALSVGAERCVLEVREAALRLREDDPETDYEVRVSEEVLTQLLFGFRPVGWAAAQPGQDVPEELAPVLEVLFPLEATWIAGSDAF
jgi:predicted N-acetyltransferase YhbS